MPGPGVIVDGFAGQVLALIVARREQSPKQLREAFGRGHSAVATATAQLIEREMITATGSTKNRRLTPTQAGKKARIRNGEEVNPVTHVGGNLDMDLKVRAVAERNGRNVDPTLTIRKATPEELAGCRAPRPSSTAPAAAERSSAEKSTTSSTGSPSTNGHGAASAPAPASPPPASDQPDPDAFFPDCTPECDWRDGPIHASECPHREPAEDDEPVVIDLAEIDDELDAEDASHARTEPEEAEQPATDPGPVNAAPDDRTEEEGQPSQDAAAAGREAAAPDAISYMGAVGTFEVDGTLHSFGDGGHDPVRARREDETVRDPGRFHEDIEGRIGHARPTLDDVDLAREQLRARYVMRLIEIVHDQAPEHIFDRIERLTT